MQFVMKCCKQLDRFPLGSTEATAIFPTPLCLLCMVPLASDAKKVWKLCTLGVSEKRLCCRRLMMEVDYDP
jgi:hypothetical protein